MQVVLIEKSAFLHLSGPANSQQTELSRVVTAVLS
jgi:hypothetical protein